MQRVHGSLAHRAQIISLKDIQGFEQHRAAGGRLRHGDNLISAIGTANCRANDRLIAFKIIDRDDAACALNSFGEFLRDGASIESLRPMRSDRFKCCGQIGLNEFVVLLQ